MNVLASPGQLRASYIRWALLFVPAIVLLGMLSGQLAGGGSQSAWFAALEKPSAYPPAATFGVVWIILYAMMGFALAMVAAARGASGRTVAILAFAVQLAINLAWAPVFFAGHDMTSALYLLLALDVAVAITLVLFWRVRSAAGLLLLPYFAWILFATYLNWAILDANRHLDGKEVSGAVQRIEL